MAVSHVDGRGAGAEGGRRDVACVGDNCVDVSLDSSGTTVAVKASRVEFAGGNALNVAVALARRGLRVSYLGAIGDDPQADLITHAAAAAGVDTSHLIRVPGPTGRTVVARDQATG